MYVARLEVRRWASHIASALVTVPSSVPIEPKINPKDDFDISLEDEPRSLLLPPEDDISSYGQVNSTFNFAQYINSSEALQNFVKLGVNLHKVEKKPAFVKTLLSLDFERDVKKYLIFLNDYVSANELGAFITCNPLIFKQDLDHLQVRINYLQSKNFTSCMIKRIISKNPFWLMFKTLNIDARLGYFQKTYSLTGTEVRNLTCTQPRLITYNMQHLTINNFTLREEMGFSPDEVKNMILQIPRVLMKNQLSIIKSFNYVHLKMNIPHDQILQVPSILLFRAKRIKERDEFLKKVRRAQYDCTKPNYVSLNALIEGTDAKFCLDVAKCSLTDYNTYLKSL